MFIEGYLDRLAQKTKLLRMVLTCTILECFVNFLVDPYYEPKKLTLVIIKYKILKSNNFVVDF